MKMEEEVSSERTVFYQITQRHTYIDKNLQFFNPVACCFLYEAKDLSAPSCIGMFMQSAVRIQSPTLWSLRRLSVLDHLTVT
jgi:hypothetical protein